MKVTRFLAAFLLFAVSLSADSLQLNTRKQVKAGDKYVGKTEVTKWDAKKTAVVICDMWAKHWCARATGRVGEMAPRMNAVVEAALAHKTPDAVQAAYRRTTYLGTKEDPGMRVKLMHAWGAYCSGTVTVKQALDASE